MPRSRASWRSCLPQRMSPLPATAAVDSSTHDSPPPSGSQAQGNSLPLRFARGSWSPRRARQVCPKATKSSIQPTSGAVSDSTRPSIQAAVTSTREAAAHRSERLLHLGHVGAMVRIRELADGGLADAQPAGKLHLGDALRPHGRIERKLAATTVGTGTDTCPPATSLGVGMSHFSWTYPARAVARASSAIAKASARSRPPVMASGTSGNVATSPPSSSGVS